MKTFDPTREAPKNEEQAEVTLRHERHRLVGSCLVGIFRCKLAQGADLLVACREALEAGLPQEYR